MTGRTLEPGTQVARYRVVSLLGAGGMGEVYRATDPDLGRDVALKVLPPSVAEDAERLARFDREARTLASLNHPNIAAIYGIERAAPSTGSGQGITALAMELVEGPTLAERIAQGPLPLDEALAIARQIATALESAHENGIVHRDLKPANVKVREDGTVKVLDFGLAKVVESSAASGDFANSPTATLSAMTERGVILGTAAYMAPEQARGRVVDKRADIWAFGVVLYEMVTGRRLFKGEDLTEIVAAVVKDQPDLAAAPATVRRLLARCLEKDPKKRLRDIGDAWELLDESAATADDRQPVRRQWVAWTVAAAFALTSVLALAWPRTQSAEPLAAIFEVGPAPGTTMTSPENTTALSPDGRYIVFSAIENNTWSLWLRNLASGEVRALAGTDNAMYPVWSPDSRALAFGTRGGLRRLDVDGGPTQLVHDFGRAITPLGGWNRDGTILASSGGTLVRLPASGGEPEPVIAAIPEASGTNLRIQIQRAQFLPDGRHFLYFHAPVAPISSDDAPAFRGVYASSLDAPETRVQILQTDRMATYVPSSMGAGGWLLFVRDRTLFAQPFDAGALRLTGAPAPLVEDVNLEGTDLGQGFVYDRSFPGFWVSEAGVLAYRTGTREAPGGTLTWFDRQGRSVGTIGTTEGRSASELALSPDGSRLAIYDSVPQRGGLASESVFWLFDVARGSRTRLATEQERVSYPVWSPDGREMLFISQAGLVRKTVGVVGQERVILPREQVWAPTDWSRDGRFALLSFIDRTGSTEQAPVINYDITVLSLDTGGEPTDYLASRSNESFARFSPDGRWVAYVSDVSGRNEVYVSPFPDASTAPAVMISTAGGSTPRWRRDGRGIWYVAPTGLQPAPSRTASPQQYTLMEVPISIGPDSTVRPGSPTTLFPLPAMGGINAGWLWDVTPDGQRFVALTRDQASADVGPLTVVLNWEARLRRSGVGR